MHATSCTCIMQNWCAITHTCVHARTCHTHAHMLTHTHACIPYTFLYTLKACNMYIMYIDIYNKQYKPIADACYLVSVYSNSITLHPQNGEELIENGHYAQDDIEARVESLFTLWDQLTEATKSKGRGLVEALSLMSFNRQVDTVHAMITDRVCVMYYQ